VSDIPAASPSQQRTWRRALVAWVGIAAAALVAYGPVLRGGFIWDDDGHVTRPDLRTLQGLRRIWLEQGATQQYYPVLHSAFWVEHRLWGDSSTGYHLLNVLLHATAAFLLGLVLRKLAQPPARTGGFCWWWLAALGFALHPVCVESVAWISEQKNTLSTVFYLLAALVYLRWRANDAEGGRGGRFYLAATGLFVLAILSKSVTATLPAALLVVAWWQRGRLSWKRDVIPLLPWLVLGLGSGLFTAWVERRYIGAQGAAFDLGVMQRVLLAGRAVAFYLAKLLWPANLMFVYPRWHVDAGAAWQYVFPVGIAVSLTVLWLVRRRTRGPLAAALFFVGTLFPALGFVNVYPFVFSYVADHFQYLASLGIIAAICGSLGRSLRFLQGAALALLCVLGVLTFRQCRVYRDVGALYTTTLESNPDCWLAHDNLGVVLAREGRLDEAIGHYREAIRLNPDFPETYNNLGNAMARLGRPAEATAAYAQAVRLRPGFAEAEFNWGNALSDAGDLSAAAVHYEKALGLRPAYPEAQYRLGNARANSGRLTDAIAHYQAALRLRPGYAEALATLGLAFHSLGRSAEALDTLRAAVRLSPGYPEAHAYLGLALAGAGRYPEAVDEYRRALELRPGDADVHYQLGVALRALGENVQAAAEFELAERPQGR
jgi:tetratricopeptide (TPR) repeat protein